MPPKYITPEMLNKSVETSNGNELDKGIKSLDQVTTIIDKVSNLMDKMVSLKKNNNEKQTDVSTTIENKANKLANQKINQNMEKQIVYREPLINYKGISEELLASIEKLIKDTPERTLKDYYEKELKKLQDGGLLNAVVEQFIKKFIQND